MDLLEEVAGLRLTAAEAVAVCAKAPGAQCAALPPHEVDRFFHSDARLFPDEHETAKRICAACPMRLDCLILAMQAPPKSSCVVAGMPAHMVSALERRSRREKVPAHVLAREVLGC
jgi:hypothetical protein